MSGFSPEYAAELDRRGKEFMDYCNRRAAPTLGELVDAKINEMKSLAHEASEWMSFADSVVATLTNVENTNYISKELSSYVIELVGNHKRLKDQLKERRLLMDDKEKSMAEAGK